MDDRPVLYCINEEGEPYGGGKFGFRQLYLSTISYDNLRVYEAAMPGRKVHLSSPHWEVHEE